MLKKKSATKSSLVGWQGLHSAGIKSPSYTYGHPVLGWSVERMEAGVKGRRKHSILDIGSGFSQVTSHLKNPKISVVASEPTFVRSSMPHTVEYRRLRSLAEALPFGKERFDKIFMSFVFEYVDREKTLSEIKRVLKKKGKAIFVFHHPSSVEVGSIKRNAAKTARELALLDSIKKNRYNIGKYRAEFVELFSRQLYDKLDLTSSESRKQQINESIAGMSAVLESVRPIWSKGKQNKVFRSEKSIRGFFKDSGLKVDELEVIKDSTGLIQGYGVVLEKQ
ncbi:MAG: methyltransferase domain-containing protein [Candidatus Diapherotrites archaeon]